MTRRHGEGTVEKRGDRWRFRSVDGAGGRFTSKAEHATEKDALRALALFRKKILAGELVAEKGMTLRDYWERRYLPRLERNVERGTRAPGTLGFYRSHWPQLDAVADVSLRALDVPRITRWVESLDVERPGSYLAVLRAILQEAITKDFLIEANPARSVRVDEADTDEEKAPTPDETKALLSCEAIPLADRLIIGFALGAGLRPGEWRTLRLDDVHLDDAKPWVLVQFGTPGGPTKTGKRRRVPLLGLALGCLRRWLAGLPAYAPRNPLGLVFPTPTGRTRTNEPFGRRKAGKRQLNRWHGFLVAAGITRRLTPHGLRHGCATGLLTGTLGDKLDVAEVQTLLGHGQLATTQRYLHHGERDLFRAVPARERSPNGPGGNDAAPENALFQGIFGGLPSVVPTGGLDPSDLPRLAIVGATQGESAGSGTDPGLMLARVRAGDWPTLEEFRALVAESSHPVVSAVRRLDGPAWRAAGLALLELLVSDGAASRRGSGR